MDIQSMFVANKAISEITNQIELSNQFNAIEKGLLIPVMEEVINVYHGVPETDYVPSSDTSGLMPVRLMLFAEDVKIRRVAFNIVRMRLSTLANETVGLTTMDVQTVANQSQSEDPREVMRKVNNASANTRKLFQIINNLLVIVYPIVTQYANFDKDTDE